jgi:hypothetical protein
MDETALKSLSGRPLLDGAPRAIGPSTFAPFHSSFNASYPAFTLQATIKMDPSYVMYMVSPYLTSFMLSCLAGLAGTRSRSIFGRRSSAGGSFFTTAVQHSASRMAAACVVAQNLLGDASARTTLADAALCFLQTFPNASGLRTRRDREHHPALQARNEHCPREHAHVPCCRRWWRGGVLAMLRRGARAYSRSDLFLLRPVPVHAGAGGNAPIVLGRYFEDVYCTCNVRRRLLRSRCCMLTAPRSPDSSRTSRSRRSYTTRSTSGRTRAVSITVTSLSSPCPPRGHDRDSRGQVGTRGRWSGSLGCRPGVRGRLRRH